MGCGCGGSTTAWTPVTAQQAKEAQGELVSDANERIQQARREQLASQTWGPVGPGTWDGHRREPAQG